MESNFKSLHRRSPLALCGALAIAGLGVLSSGCQKEGCLTGDDPECIVPSPCQALSYACEGGAVSVHILEAGEEVFDAHKSLAAPGDIVLSNDQVQVVIDALDHPHYVAPSGGAIIDMATIGGEDTLNIILQASGVLPNEAAYYTERKVIEEDGVAAVQFRGHLDGRPDVPVATRYEIRPCEPGVRVRTELVNLEPDPMSLFLADGYYHGGKGLLPFTPNPGAGFEHPSFGLSTLPDGITSAPYLVAAMQSEPASSYVTVACNAEEITGFHGAAVVAAGLEARVLMPRDYGVYERFIGVADGSAVSGAADLGLELRNQLFDEPWVWLTGTFSVGDAYGGLADTLRASVLISEGTEATAVEERIPWTQAFPDDAGRIAVRVPPDRSYLLEVESYGVVVATEEIEVGSDAVDFGDLEIRGDGTLTLDATVDGIAEDVVVYVHAADDATEETVTGQLVGQFSEFAPLLGPPYGGSPAGNVVLINGPVDVTLPPGAYDVFATAGPFSTMATTRGIEVTAGSSESILLEIENLPILPDGALSADLHVHGGLSFDATFPDEARVRSFLASGLDVIAATDHSVAGTYADMVELLDVQDQVAVMVGIETTGFILFDLVPDAPYPQVIGHWNYWPLIHDPDGPYLGAPWDQMALPGEMMTRIRDADWPADTGIVQLNHPVAYLDFGRDLGWIDAITLDGTQTLPGEYDGTRPTLLQYQPPDADFGNADFDCQEVMNGTNNDRLLAYRAYWFWSLNQGMVRAGTANSDSHSLSVNAVGTPRTVVWADTTVEDFDYVAFNDAVRAGRMIGTNGPLLLASVTDGSAVEHLPGVAPIEGDTDGATLTIRVDAAPWVPVDEVRIVVNGEVVRTLTDELDHPADPLGADGIERLDVQLALDDLLPSSGDAWLVVEAGHALQPNADLDCNGWPDTGDNNGDGVIDWRDVEDLDEDPGLECLEDVGPLAEPPPPDDRESADYLFRAVVRDGYPAAFTNPLIFDRDSDGYEGVE